MTSSMVLVSPTQVDDISRRLQYQVPFERQTLELIANVARLQSEQLPVSVRQHLVVAEALETQVIGQVGRDLWIETQAAECDVARGSHGPTDHSPRNSQARKKRHA